MAKKQKITETATVLGTYDGSPIIDSSIALVGAGDGLSKALEIDPVAIGMNDTVYVVVETVASQIKFKADRDEPNMLHKTTVLSAVVATIVDKELVDEVLTAQQAKIDEAAGKMKIPFEDDPNV